MLRFFHRIAQRARGAVATLVERHRSAIAYRDLQLLDERVLRDIGLSHRAAVEFSDFRPWHGRRDLTPRRRRGAP
ncbi:MAG: hypothetical protein ACXWIG_05220 [Caldimonas sp.]